ncbi:hypothetical protein PHSY_000778 [Pseudozyma hubeiensis SY62]|uniref:Rho-GAP domain-containing protein n=1 Tax=Pseudozyma hubeiensis (strain SY62) TaxID=1305764 RepID=R9P528_PSEHS|nr:hypothetical protein PHSY_000778 [Pseudozyma hubeiensis SY62]GAC93215.1 hypothetical protein PHSY_000778 [Pseudozyma hubeiensis SY62]
MATLIAAMHTSPSQNDLDQEHESPGTSNFNTPISTPSGHRTPAAGYRTATATLSNVFASLWETYNQQQESGPSRLQPPPSSSTHTPHDSPSPSIPGGWGNLLSWGPAAGRTKTSTLRKSASPSRASPARQGRSRAAIPFNISAPLEAGNNAEKVEGAMLATERPTRLDHTVTSSNFSPTSSPRRRPLAGIFEDLPASTSTSPPHTPSPRSPSSRSRNLAAPSPTFKNESPSGAYATLSRLQSKPSVSKLRSGSGFLSPSSSFSTNTGRDQTPSPGAHSRPAADWTEAIARAERLDTYVRRIVFQAGLDYETRPMVVLAACCLPSPAEVDYDALLDRIMDTLDLFVENDYTVIYFNAGGSHRPGWSWLWRAYQRLDRRFRKNLKKLYIVHPTWFTKGLMRVVTTGSYLVSPKFSKKVVQLETLSRLAELVPLTQVDIPPEVLQYNSRFEAKVVIPAAATGSADAEGQDGGEKVFGVDLVQLMGEFGESGGVPRVVRDCAEAILNDNDGIIPATVEGIFRRSPSSALLKTAQESYDRGHPVSLSQYRDPHIPAVLLKMFLRSLPRPIFPSSLYPLIQSCPPPPLFASDPNETARSNETIDYLRTKLLPALQPACSGILLSYVLEMLHKVSLRKQENKMDAANLATVVAPNLVSSGNAMKDVLICRVEGINSMAGGNSVQNSPRASPGGGRKMSLSNGDAGGSGGTTLGSILRFCIERYYEIFDEVSFVGQVNRVQELVDEWSREEAASSRSPSVTSGLGLTGHRRLESGNSDFSHWASANGDAESDRKSGTTGKSIASRDGFRAPTGFGRGTIGRNSSGSLRLTKGRLGSNTNLRSGFTPMNAAIGGKAAAAGTTTMASGTAAVDTDGLTSQLSGVTLTGANATGRFSSPSVDRAVSASTAVDVPRSTSQAGSGPSSVSSSPLLSRTGWTPDHPSSSHQLASPTSPTLLNSPQTRKKSTTRRELSEVVEADDD